MPVPPPLDSARERSWKQALTAISDLASGAVMGAHAERMRLWRIMVIAAGEHAPVDLRAIFARVPSEECFYERAFRSRTGKEALRATRLGMRG